MCGASARIDELASLCLEKKLLLVEDACQAFGASYRGRALGTIGDAGCYSFDFNKIVTCGEGGAIITNSRETYERADKYHDHGHDHSQSDRGAEGHDFPGYNYRIFELHAAIGLAQITKTEKFIAIHRENKKILRDALSAVSGVTLRTILDPDGDSGTFLSFLLPTEDSARAAAASLKGAGIDGVFHWYDNNWHYIRNWDHFKNRSFASHVSCDILRNMPDYSKVEFESDKIVSRCVSIAIKMGWTKDEVYSRAERITNAVKSAI
jgi:8-amino-3,8-dideoxy-alpha-D-manno-octulosonate transaminase